LITRWRAGLAAWMAGAAAIFGLVWGRPAMHRGVRVAPPVSISPASILANGWDTAILTIDAPPAGRPAISIVENPHSAVIGEIERTDNRWQAEVRAGVMPGRVRLRIEIPGFRPAAVELTSAPATADSFADGTPDFLRLDNESDRRAFRRWFTWLAEAQYFQSPGNRPGEIDDCAALIRYAFREALRAHESGWAEAAGVPVVPAFAAIGKYQYPYTPLGAALFRVRAGPYRPSDVADGTFAQFADAETLWRRNTYPLGRDLRRALPGDLLFFRHETGRMPFHSMIYLGDSQLRRDGNRYVIYHTGPGEGAGEIRRLTLEELVSYPRREWRPAVANPGFLGVFRWNILRKADDDDARHE